MPTSLPPYLLTSYNTARLIYNATSEKPTYHATNPDGYEGNGRPCSILCGSCEEELAAVRTHICQTPRRQKHKKTKKIVSTVQPRGQGLCAIQNLAFRSGVVTGSPPLQLPCPAHSWMCGVTPVSASPFFTAGIPLDDFDGP